MSVKCFARKSGAGKAVPSLWAPGVLAFFLQEKPSMPIKFLVLGGGGVSCFFLGGGSADFIFMGAGIFLI